MIDVNCVIKGTLMKRWMNCALVGSLVCGTLSTSSSVAVDVDTQLNLLTAYRSHISYGGTVRDSLPEPFYGILNDMSHHLTKSCQNHECEEWAANGNGKRLPDDVLNILSEEIISFQNQKNLSLYAWNVFFFRLSVLLSIYPEMGYHPATYAGQEIPNDTTGRIYQYEGTDLFLDLYDTVRDLDTREKFNDVFYSQEKTKSFFAKRLLKPNPFYQHLGLNFIPNISSSNSVRYANVNKSEIFKSQFILKIPEIVVGINSGINLLDINK